MTRSHPEDRRYLCRFHPCNEILMRLYEIFETGKKQDLTSLMCDRRIGKTGKVGMLKGLEKLDLNYRTLTLFLPSSLAK